MFADGSAAVVVGNAAYATEFVERPLWDFEKYQSLALKHSHGDMTWHASDIGFLMYLSARVPEYLSKDIYSFSCSLVDRILLEECIWAIHPGGKSILEGVEECCDLKKWQTQASWDVLKNFGNMSSATFLFVLDHIRKQDNNYQKILGLAAGPGLSLEGIVLAKREGAGVVM